MDKFTGETSAADSLNHEKIASVSDYVKEVRRQHEELDRVRLEFDNVVALERNFAVEITDDEDGAAKLVLNHKTTGMKIDLIDFLPKGCVFKKGKSFVERKQGEDILPAFGQVDFPEKEMDLRGSLISLFHEIGHANEKQEHSTVTTFETVSTLIQTCVRWLNNVRVERQSKVDAPKLTITIPSFYALMPKWYVDKVSEARATKERNAWAFALDKLRGLQQKGYNVFSGFDNVEQIKMYIDYCLLTYELCRYENHPRDAAEMSNEEPIFVNNNARANEFINRVDPNN